MTFANPYWFFALLPLGLWFLWIFKSRKKNHISLPYSDISLLKPWLKTGLNEDKILLALKAISVFFVIIALARPQKILTTKEPPKPVVDIVICLDTSMSMSAIDFDPDNRLDAAKKAAEEFIGKRLLDRIGLVVFGGRAITQCPLTLDHETLIEFLRDIPINATQADGTAIGTAIALASDQLSKSEAKTKLIILLTDGRNNTGTIDPMTASNAASELGIKIYTIGCAVPGGGLVPVDDPIFGKRLVRMAEDLDEPTLLEISRITSAKYYRVTSAKRFKTIYDDIDKMEKTKIDIDSTSQTNDIVLPFLMISFLVFSLTLLLENTIWYTVP